MERVKLCGYKIHARARKQDTNNSWPLGSRAHLCCVAFLGAAAGGGRSQPATLAGWLVGG
jgi:hypothetical protein